MHNGASRANRLRAPASVHTVVFYGCNAGQPLCCSVGTPSTCCVGKSPFCSAGAPRLCNAGRRSTMQCWRSTRLAAELLVVRAKPRNLAHYHCRVTLHKLTGHYDSSYADDVEIQRSTQGYCFSVGAGAVSWRSTRSSSVASSSAEAEIYAGAMAAQELRWLTFLLTDLCERPRSAPTLYADNKAMVLLCREPRLKSRVKRINVRYFLL
ncbi:unnamed protein product [Closterium sp. NIES-53]